MKAGQAVRRSSSFSMQLRREDPFPVCSAWSVVPFPVWESNTWQGDSQRWTRHLTSQRRHLKTKTFKGTVSLCAHVSLLNFINYKKFKILKSLSFALVENYRVFTGLLFWFQELRVYHLFPAVFLSLWADLQPLYACFSVPQHHETHISSPIFLKKWWKYLNALSKKFRVSLMI